MTKKTSALTARTQFGQIMQRAVERGARFLVDRRGRPAVVIMSVDDYVRTLAPEQQALKATRRKAARSGLDHLNIEEIGVEVSAYRNEKRASPRVRK